MEQLLFPSDINQAEKDSNAAFPLPINHELPHTLNNEYYNKYSREAFLIACSYKNNQMQEFDKWKHEKQWKLNNAKNLYWRLVDDSEGLPTFEYKSFSELFEIFIKETSK